LATLVLPARLPDLRGLDLVCNLPAKTMLNGAAADFLREEGIPPTAMDLPAGTGHGDVYAILSALWAWGTEGRRLARRFIGRWLDDRLDIGPDPELRARLIEHLARQGWRVRLDDSVLVAEAPTRGIPLSAPFLRVSRLHPAIEALTVRPHRRRRARCRRTAQYPAAQDPRLPHACRVLQQDSDRSHQLQRLGRTVGW